MAEMLMSGLEDTLIHLSKNYGRTPLSNENAKRHEMGQKRGLQNPLISRENIQHRRSAGKHHSLHGKSVAVKRKVELMTCQIRSSPLRASHDVPFWDQGACPMFPVVLLSRSLWQRDKFAKVFN